MVHHIIYTALSKSKPAATTYLTTSSLLPLGHLSAQRVALQVKRSGKSTGQSVASFLEELVVRRELTDNFCFYNKNYDNLEGQLRFH